MIRELFFNNKKGFSVAEVLVASAIFAIFVTSLSSIFLYLQTIKTTGNKTRALFLAEEGLEATRNIKDYDFANLEDGAYGLDASLTNNQFEFSGSEDEVDIFTRQIEISSVDDNTKQVESLVTWQEREATKEISLFTEFTNWLEETVDSFDWTAPAIETSLDISGNQNGLKIKVSGNYAYIIRESGSPDFAVIDISDISAPSLTDSLSLSGNLYDLAIAGNYAYVASTHNSRELQVVDISDPNNISAIKNYNASGNADATSLYIEGDYLYMAKRSNSGNPEFFVFDINADPADPSLVGSEDLYSNCFDVVVNGDYAYVASSNNSRELQIIDVSDPAAPTFTNYINASGSSNALSLAVSDTLFLGRSNGDLYIYDLSAPSAPIVLGYFDAQDDIRDISLNALGEYAFLATDYNSYELQVVDASDTSLPILHGSLDISPNADLNGVYYDEDLNTVFAVGEDNSQELIIFSN